MAPWYTQSTNGPLSPVAIRASTTPEALTAITSPVRRSGSRAVAPTRWPGWRSGATRRAAIEPFTAALGTHREAALRALAQINTAFDATLAARAARQRSKRTRE